METAETSEATATRILVVGADASAAEALKFAIEEDGYEVATSTDLDDAMAKASAETFSAAVLDVTMDDLSRFGILKKLNADALSSLPIVVMTDVQEGIVRKHLADYDGFVSRDADVDELVAHLERLTRTGSVADVPAS